MSEERLEEILWGIYEGFSFELGEVIDEFKKLNKKNNELKEKNKELTKKNKELEDTIERFTNALNSAEKLIMGGTNK